jgi:esterase/lipase
MSDLEGNKPKVFLNFARKNKLGFIALEYSGHGKSTGKFTKGNISKWSRETYLLVKKIVKKNKIIFIGSSMGAWITLNQFKFFKNQIKGFLGIGSAPEFLENLMWKKFSKKMKSEIIQKKILHLKHGNYSYPITLQLLNDGRKNKVFKKKITSKIKVTMVHGQKDDVVPVSYSRKILKMFTNAKKKLVIVKNGDHSLSSNKGLKILKREIKLITN